MIALFLKCTLILLAAMLGCYVASETVGSGRRLVWLAGLSATLLLPLGGWLPKTHVRLPTDRRLGQTARNRIYPNAHGGRAGSAWRGQPDRALCSCVFSFGICRTARMIREAPSTTRKPG